LEVKEVKFDKVVKVYVQKDITKLSIKVSDYHVITHTFDTNYFTTEVVTFYISLRGGSKSKPIEFKNFYASYQLYCLKDYVKFFYKPLNDSTEYHFRLPYDELDSVLIDDFKRQLKEAFSIQ
tara:strand:- start:210 stop:575 length:366 start_codon:yes stop_codon:yes gene_type:complete